MKKISGERVFSGKLIAVDVDQVIEPEASKPARREVVRHAGAAAVVPCLPGAKILLVRQYRYAPDSYLWEIPAGILEPVKSRKTVQPGNWPRKQAISLKKSNSWPGSTALRVSAMRLSTFSAPIISDLGQPGRTPRNIWKRGLSIFSKPLI